MPTPVHAAQPPILLPSAQASHGVYWSCTLFELLLLGKAVVVAVLAEDRLLPPGPDAPAEAVGHAGLLCIYGSIVAALLCSFLEGWLGQRMVARWRKQCEALEGCAAAGSSRSGSSNSSAAQPLLGKAAATDEVRAGGGPGFVVPGCWPAGCWTAPAPTLLCLRLSVWQSPSPATRSPSPLCPGRLSLRASPCAPLPQGKESATIPELILLSAPDAHILLLAFTAGAAAALGQVRSPAARRPRVPPCSNQVPTHPSTPPAHPPPTHSCGPPDSWEESSPCAVGRAAASSSYTVGVRGGSVASSVDPADAPSSPRWW